MCNAYVKLIFHCNSGHSERVSMLRYAHVARPVNFASEYAMKDVERIEN